LTEARPLAQEVQWVTPVAGLPAASEKCLPPMLLDLPGAQLEETAFLQALLPGWISEFE
jgi:hypothetical protein